MGPAAATAVAFQYLHRLLPEAERVDHLAFVFAVRPRHDTGPGVREFRCGRAHVALLRGFGCIVARRLRGSNGSGKSTNC